MPKSISHQGAQALRGLSAESCRDRLDYDPETGIFRLKARPGDAWHIRSWNTKFAGKVTGTPNSHGYLRICLEGVSYKAHRLAWLWFYGRHPSDCIDHINGDKSDNRIANLRDASHAQNKRNVGRPGNNSSGFKGVYRHTQAGRWVARIKGDGKYRHIGIFPTIEEAAEAYRKAAEAEHGDFARLE